MQQQISVCSVINFCTKLKRGTATCHSQSLSNKLCHQHLSTRAYCVYTGFTYKTKSWPVMLKTRLNITPSLIAFALYSCKSQNSRDTQSKGIWLCRDANDNISTCNWWQPCSPLKPGVKQSVCTHNSVQTVTASIATTFQATVAVTPHLQHSLCFCRLRFDCWISCLKLNLKK